MAGGDAWRLAEEAAMAAGVELRPLSGLEDADRILRVMVATWGEHQLVPREMMLALADSGNEPYGAFLEGDLAGYVLGWMGLDLDGPHVHSHMLAVLPGLRSRGVGYALKLAQRARALDAGYHVVRWTFDPLQARNAHFNLNKLGVLCDRFRRDFYGEMTDALNQGDRSDRLVVRWDLDHIGPYATPSGPDVAALRASGSVKLSKPERGEEPRAAAGGTVRVSIPADYSRLKEREPGLATEWREAVGEILEECFGFGMIVAGFVSERERDHGGSHYVLATPEAIGDGPR
jgi:predicted GNAT superfamily acetyltransferase